MYQRVTGDDRRSTTNTNDLRGKILRIKVKDNVTAADFNKADTGSGTGAYTIPAGNLKEYSQAELPGRRRQAGFNTKFRPEIYAMGFRNPFRIQVDENNVAYVSDYSPDSNTPQRGRGPSGVGRFEIVRKPSNYGYPLCYSSKLGYNKWNFQEFAPGTTTVGIPATNPPSNDCARTDGLPNESRWVRDGGPAFEPGLALDASGQRSGGLVLLPRQQRRGPARHAVRRLLRRRRRARSLRARPPSARACSPSSTRVASLRTASSSTTTTPPTPNTKKFPAYYDNSIFLGEFGQDTLREMKLDSQNRVFKINNTLDCGQALQTNSVFEFECDNPMDMQFGADGNLYLLTYGDGFFNINPDAGLYRFDYVKGQRAPKAVLTTDKTDGACAADGQLQGLGFVRRRSG